MSNQLHVVNPSAGRRSIGAFEHLSDCRQKWGRNIGIPRHRHAEGYAALVLSGGFQECGNRGRFNVGPGDLLLHGAFDTHLDHVFIVGAEVLHLRLPGLNPIPHSFARVRDPDLIVRTAETDPISAMDILCEQMSPVAHVPEDWPDLLVAALNEDPNRRPEDWAEMHGLDLQDVGQRFSRIYGVSLETFRSEIRAHKAFEQIVKGTDLLGKVLETSGFTTEIHLSRAIRSLTGATPKSWVERATLPYFEVTG